jgi:hypothetical protein
LDKAILELLNIEEGAVLKISTDGKSIVLTPQKIAETQHIHETYNSDRAWLDVAAQEMSKRYKISEKSKKELINLYKKQQDLYLQLDQNSDFREKLSHLQKQFNNKTSPEFLEAYNALRSKFSPELVTTEKELASFETTHKLETNDSYKSVSLNENQKITMQQEFAATFEKHATAFASYNVFLNNPDYQHEVQLIAEKYKDTKNSAEYMEAIEELQNKYSPETQQLRNELKAIGQKYSTIFTNQKF